jgi:hypothetical protein
MDGLKDMIFARFKENLFLNPIRNSDLNRDWPRGDF